MKKILQKLLPKIIGAQINLISLWSPKGAARKAFHIFCSPRAGKIKSEQQEFLNTAESITLDINPSTCIQTYHWKGKGPTVLLLHGWESNAHRWWKLISELRKLDYYIIAMDAPAHGNSNGKFFHVPLYTESLQFVTQTYKPQIHIGHSIGGLTSVFHYYKNRPEHVKKMVVLGAPSELSAIMKDYQHLLGMNNRVMQSLNILIQERFGFSFEEFSGCAFAKAIDIPGLIIHDAYDQIAPVSASRNIHKSWKDSLYIETTGLGHSLYQDEVRKEILAFIS